MLSNLKIGLKHLKVNNLLFFKKEIKQDRLLEINEENL